MTENSIENPQGNAYLELSYTDLANVVTDGTDLDTASSSLRTGRLEVGQVFCTHVSAIKLDCKKIDGLVV